MDRGALLVLVLLLAVVLLLILLAPVVAGQEVYECRRVVGNRVAPVSCKECIDAFVGKLLSNELQRYGVSYRVVSSTGYSAELEVYYGNDTFRISIACSETECWVTYTDKTQRLLEVIHDVSLRLVRDDREPICLLFKPGVVGKFVCWDNESNVFYHSEYKAHELCAEIQSPVDIKNLVLPQPPVGGWDIATKMWDAFVGTLGSLGPLFVESLRALGWLTYQFFAGMFMWAVSAIMSIALFAYMAAPVIVVFIAYTPYIVIAAGLAAIVDAFQRAFRQKSIDPLLNLPSRLYSIYVKPIVKIIELGKNVFQAVHAGFELAIRAIHVIIKIIKYIVASIFGSG